MQALAGTVVLIAASASARTGSLENDCDVGDRLEIQFLLPDDLESKERQFFLRERKFITTRSPEILSTYERACRQVENEESKEILFLGRVYNPKSKKSLWITSKGVAAFEDRKVNLSESDVEALIEKIEKVLPKVEERGKE